MAFKPRTESELFFRSLKRKVVICTALVTIGFAAMSLRLWNLQIAQHEALSNRAESNRMRRITLDGLRGKILDRNGKILVDNRPSFQLSIIPEDVENPKETLAYLNNFIPVDIEAVISEMKKTRPFKPVVIKRDISREEVAFIEERRISLPGIFLEIKPIRNYIYNDFSSHLLGYLGAISPKQYASAEPLAYSRDDFIGKYGIEKIFEGRLRGVKGFKHVEVDAAGRELGRMSLKPPSSGADISLTLDYDVQAAAEKAMEGKMGAAIAIDPDNGDILAYVSKPSFDPNIFSFGITSDEWKKLLNDDFHPLQNRVTQAMYPPGSTFKIITTAAALEEGIITPETQIFCPGHYRLGKRTYRCWKRQGHGWMDVHTAIVQSCDVFFYNTGLKLGVDTIAKYARIFGLGEKTGVELEGENSGLIPTTEWKKRVKKEPWILGETVSVSIGQGFVLTTPIQQARMVAAIANGGWLVRPRVTLPKGEDVVHKEKIPISANTIKLIAESLRGVVNEDHGTGWRLRKGPYEYAGKTGTSQVIRMKRNEKWDNNKIKIKHRDHGWFVAFAPYDDPKIAVAVISEHGGHGGEAAAPVAKQIMDAYLKKILPKEEDAVSTDLEKVTASHDR